MHTEGMVWRSVYIDPDVDEQLRAQAKAEGVRQEEMFRRYLSRGMELASAGAARPVLADVPVALRTAYLPYQVTETLRVQSYRLGTSTMDLMRQYTRLGAEAKFQR